MRSHVQFDHAIKMNIIAESFLSKQGRCGSLVIVSDFDSFQTPHHCLRQNDVYF